MIAAGVGTPALQEPTRIERTQRSGLWVTLEDGGNPQVFWSPQHSSSALWGGWYASALGPLRRVPAARSPSSTPATREGGSNLADVQRECSAVCRGGSESPIRRTPVAGCGCVRRLRALPARLEVPRQSPPLPTGGPRPCTPPGRRAWACRSPRCARRRERLLCPPERPR